MKQIYYLPILLLLLSSGIVMTASCQEQVSQTVYVFDGSFNGTMLSDVQVVGQDAAGNAFQGVTNSNGVVVINGQPGTWQFTFIKDGYDSLSLNYDVTETGEGAVYLQRASQSQEEPTNTQTYQQPSSQYSLQPTQMNMDQSSVAEANGYT